MDMEMQEACMPFKLQGTEQVLTLEILSLLACSLLIILFLMLKKNSDLLLFFCVSVGFPQVCIARHCWSLRRCFFGDGALSCILRHCLDIYRMASLLLTKHASKEVAYFTIS